MTVIFGLQTCKACEHATASAQFNGNFECHEGPPGTQLLVAATAQGPQVQGFITSPAIVGPDMRCARWKRRIERAAVIDGKIANVGGN